MRDLVSWASLLAPFRTPAECHSFVERCSIYSRHYLSGRLHATTRHVPHVIARPTVDVGCMYSCVRVLACQLSFACQRLKPTTRLLRPTRTRHVPHDIGKDQQPKGATRCGSRSADSRRRQSRLGQAWDHIPPRRGVQVRSRRLGSLQAWSRRWPAAQFEGQISRLPSPVVSIGSAVPMPLAARRSGRVV